MAPPVYSNGQILNASDCNLWFVPIAAYKTAVTTRNTLTVSIDPDLQITLAASAVYQVTAGIIYTSAQALRYTWTVPASSAGGYTASYNLAGTGAGTWGQVFSGTFDAAALGGSVNGVQIQGMIQSGAGGTLGFNWGSAAGPASCTLGVGSVLTARRVG